MGNKSSSKHDRNQMCGPLRNCKDGERGKRGAVGENQRRNHPGLKRRKKGEGGNGRRQEHETGRQTTGK